MPPPGNEPAGRNRHRQNQETCEQYKPEVKRGGFGVQRERRRKADLANSLWAAAESVVHMKRERIKQAERQKTWQSGNGQTGPRYIQMGCFKRVSHGRIGFGVAVSRQGSLFFNEPSEAGIEQQDEEHGDQRSDESVSRAPEEKHREYALRENRVS